MSVKFQSASRDDSRDDSHIQCELNKRKLFQSASRDDSRDDSATHLLDRRLRCFNPRPAMTHGTTRLRTYWTDVCGVSIRVPR